MKIVHVCLAGAGFNDGWGYQENMLTKYNSMAGHQVSIITSQYMRDLSGGLVKNAKTKYLDNNNCRVFRLPSKKKIIRSIRLRTFSGIEDTLKLIEPDIIFVHNFQFLDVFKIIKYKKKNSSLKLYIDSHTDMNNSANNWISLNILHKMIYKNFARMTLKYTDKIFFVSFEGKDFLRNIYKIPNSLLEFYPLGGSIVPEKIKQTLKSEIREELGFSSDTILLCHSGKMDSKKKTYELIKRFVTVKNKRLRLILIGSLSDNIKNKIEPLLKKDNRIIYLGWKNSEQLIEYIAASDLYLQPGSQSATMQNALCAGTPVLLANVKSHRVYLEGNAFAIDNFDEITEVLHQICFNPAILNEMSEKAYVIARKMLDYEKLASRITND